MRGSGRNGQNKITGGPHELRTHRHRFPALAQRALTAEPDLGLLLPCNVVIRRGPNACETVVQAIDPQGMVQLSDNPAIQAVAADADARLRTFLKNLESAARA
ncbi:DUF302 domain-containing protein [Cryobacterium psychrophilum]|uniref:DUF302 domain-containing protein n=1 Tax=Cryobacterium psychrophilum TaxID=41988 RepID=A0A4Y8KS12_9MICO|nr:uncharacterized protein DUF302 [Cryobacterium psychrophilum]TFD82420.1 DUF302 domain-containing protein [Cryobacterium psychrophilum]